jgi:hypothetical protein
LTGSPTERHATSIGATRSCSPWNHTRSPHPRDMYESRKSEPTCDMFDVGVRAPCEALNATHVEYQGFVGMTRWGGALLLGGVLFAAAQGCWCGVASAAVRLAPSQIVAPRGTRGVQPDVAVSGGGRVLVTWAAPVGVPGARQGMIEVRLARVGHAWAATHTLSLEGESPIGALGVNGTAVVAWSKFNPNTLRRWWYVSIVGMAAGDRAGPPRGRDRVRLSRPPDPSDRRLERS